MWRSPWTATLVSFLFCLRLGQAKEGPNYTFLKNATEAPRSSYYDYIIVGGGTAGCALAATLSEKYKVLLLERGGSPYGNQNITNLSTILNTLGDTSPTSASQPFISEDGVKNTRARVLGGGTCLNAGFYSRASQRYVEEAGWDGSLVNQSYKWVEKMVSFKPQVVEWQEGMKDGLLEAGITPDNGFTVDHITGTKYGRTTFDEHQHRHTAADLLQYADSSRITVILRAVAQKILFKSQDGGGESKPAAYGVEFKDSSGKKHWAYRGSEQEHRGEIILSAGALGSPQLLMLSGVGPAEHLESLGIEVVVDQPMVGQKMSDNPMNLIYIPSPVPVSISTVQTVGITSLGTFIEGLTGINLLQALSGGVIPEINNIPLERIGLLAEKIVGPLSTGYLQLKNRDPEDNPSVTFNYFQEPQDLHRCVAGLKIIFKVIESKAFSRFKDPNLSAQNMIDFIANLPLNLRPRSNNTSKSLEQFCIDTVLTIWHFHGGCRVGEVVDRDYRVMGVAGLRVIDASTFNATPGTNPQATIMMLGRYMGRKILAEGLGFQAAEHGVHLEL